ncbi:MAG: DUF294 nucleotidyltransferase-like domain-containing protein [Desulfobacula sp.]|nr:DUF294 nucleotidyltransferase-like domain-containing protein [Desulfobacula sp.]
MHSKNDFIKENHVLAAFISKLPEAILICDSDGSILLHDSQSETYLLKNINPPAIGVSMTGKPITAFIEKNLLEHSLDEINEQLKNHVTNLVSIFILKKHSLILKAQVVPVLSHTGQFTGFVVILDDITQQNEAEMRIDALLKTLSKNARSPMASIRAAIEAMKTFPQMADDRQRQFTEIIYNESIVLSELLNSVSDDYTSLINVNETLKQILIADLLQTVSRRSQDRLDIVCHVTTQSKTEQISIMADPYTMISMFFFLLERLKIETHQKEFYLMFHKKNKVAHVDICWKAGPISPKMLKDWETKKIESRESDSNAGLKDILRQHQSVIWTYSNHDVLQEMSYLRFFIPIDKRPVLSPLEPISVSPESRIQIGDIELFDHSDQIRELDNPLDNRLITELSYTCLIREINQSSTIEEIIGKHSQLPRLIHSMLTSGTKIRTVTWLVTAFSDAILHKLLALAILEIGPPPVPFAFVTLGSEGRKEQTLKTDQDNAIIFQDPQDPEDGQTIEDLQVYFLELGEKVCTWLDMSGFDFCRGGIMAKNPKWCQPLSIWKKCFSSWIHVGTPENLLHTTIFFDFRFAYGDSQITDELTAHLLKNVSDWDGFFRNIAKNAINLRPPIGLFNRFLLKSKGPHKNCLDIKMANTPIVDFARMYALKHGIKETATQDRLYQLYIKRVLSREDYNELNQAYSFNMQIRFMGQINAILGQNMKPDNYVNPKKLSSIEKRMLKEVLKKIKSMQARMKIDFIGMTDQ